MAEIAWTDLAFEDLREINRYLTREADHQTAARILATIRPPVEGRPYRSFILRGTHYVAAYRYREGMVEILRIHDQRENWRLPL